MTHAIFRLMTATLFWLPIWTASAQGEMIVRDDWASVFAKFEAKGTLLVLDEREASRGRFVFNRKRAETRFVPASTFKIPHALFALDAGVIRDEFQVIPWDGKKRSYEAWNRDQTLRSSMRDSVVWVYQTFEKGIGVERERAYMEKIHYGNADPTGVAPFWVEGNLRISAEEQVGFLQRLYRNKLPFSLESQRLVKDVMINEAGRDWILRAKTGWSGKIGWWVGWVELAEGCVFFALNIDTPERGDDLYKREAITREILESLGALPGKANHEHEGASPAAEVSEAKED
ncbi:class D beta-lactamase [Verrucomicrobiaceae bacterium 227]